MLADIAMVTASPSRKPVRLEQGADEPLRNVVAGCEFKAQCSQLTSLQLGLTVDIAMPAAEPRCLLAR